MSQFKHANVSYVLSAGSHLLRYVYEVGMVLTSGTYAATTFVFSGFLCQAISFINGRLRFTITNSANGIPTLSNPAITGSGWTGTAVELLKRNALQVAINPVDFTGANGNQGAIAAGHKVVIVDPAYIGITRTVVSANVNHFVIDAEFIPGTPLVDLPVIIGRDATVNLGLPVPASEAGAAELLGAALHLLDSKVGSLSPLWTAPTLTANWSSAHANSLHYIPGYRVDMWNMVSLRGSLQFAGTPTLPATMFTLPSGFRPASRWEQVVMGSEVQNVASSVASEYIVRVNSNGDVVLVRSGGVTAASNQWVSLGGICFPKT